MAMAMPAFGDIMTDMALLDVDFYNHVVECSAVGIHKWQTIVPGATPTPQL